MKRLSLSIIASLFLTSSIYAQLSFAPVDTLEYSSAGLTGTYRIGNAFAIDFNRDGFDDIITLEGNFVFLSLNTGSNSFKEEQLIYTDTEPIYSISNFVDVNNDTFLDMAISTAKGLKIVKTSNGKFVQMHQSVFENFSFGKLILLDYNKDGKLDLASSNLGSVLIHNDIASGFITPSTIYTEPDKYIYNFDLIDMNLDSRLDLIFYAYQGKLKVLAGNSNQQSFTEIFSKAISGLVKFELGDLNLDGFPDVTYLEWGKNIFTLVYNQSSGSYAEQTLFTNAPGNLNDFKLIDLKKNGTLDLVYNSFFSISTKENNGLGQFLAQSTLFETTLMPYTYFSFNLNNDGLEDVLISDYNKLEVVSFNGTGGLDTRVTTGYLADFRDAMSRDMDKDGFQDIISVSRTGLLFIRWGNASYDYTSYSTYPIPFNADFGAIADINGDNRQDVLVTVRSNSNSVNKIIVLESSGSRKFKEARDWKYFPQPSKPLLADINKDGVLDFVTFSSFGDKIGWLDIANTNFEEYFNTNRIFQTQSSGIRTLSNTDINSDGYIDLLASNGLTKEVSILTNDKSGSFVETLLKPNGQVNSVLNVKHFDYNGDLHKDLLILVELDSSVPFLQIFLNDKQGNFKYHTTLALNEMYQPGHIDEMDIDGDQDLDFVVSTWDYLTTNVFIRDGDTFTNVGGNVFQNVGQSSRIYQDFNGDGAPDAFSATFVYGKSFLQLNNTVHEPAQVETKITINEINLKSVRMTLSPTSSSGRLVVITQGNELTSSPVDNQFYSSNPAFGSGSALGTDSYIVHAGKLESIEVTGLSTSSNYLISVFEYNVNAPQVTIVNYTGTKIQKAFTTPNSPPQIAAVPDQSGTNLETVFITLDVTDEDNLLSHLTFKFTSSDQSVIPVSNIRTNTSGQRPVLEIQPISEGTSLIGISVKDPANNETLTSFQYISLVVGLEDARSTFQVFPNPFHSIVSVNQTEEGHTLAVFNGRGQQVKKFNTVPESIDLTDLPSGFYYFKTSNGKFMKALKH